MKILVVEDDKTIASGLEYSLQQEQYSTVLCYDVVAAKKILAEDLNYSRFYYSRFSNALL